MMVEPRRNGKGIKCAHCGHYNLASNYVCERCGTAFADVNAGETAPGMPVVPSSESTGLQPRPRPSLSQQCPACGELNRPGVILCEDCGTNLTTGERPPMSTRVVPSGSLMNYESLLDMPVGGKETLDVGTFHKASKSGTSIFESNMILRLQVEGTPKPLLLKLTQNHPLVFGRRDQSAPDVNVDLSPYGGYHRGLSRRHAAMELRDQRLEIWDLGSSNGTYLNGIRLGADQRHQLRESDEVRFGQMVIQIFFQQKVDR
jgi:pSer/pThr/pTyr-binding forkhead associated (FHA) protein/ribosomal protein L32